MSYPSCGPIPLGVRCCPAFSFAGPRPPPRLGAEDAVRVDAAPSPPSLPPLLLPPLPPARPDDDDAAAGLPCLLGGGGGGDGGSPFPLLPGALLKEKDELRASLLSRPLLPLPLPPSSLEEEEEVARMWTAPLLLLVLVLVLVLLPRDGSTKARPCRHIEAACWGCVGWCATGVKQNGLGSIRFDSIRSIGRSVDQGLHHRHTHTRTYQQGGGERHGGGRGTTDQPPSLLPLLLPPWSSCSSCSC